MIKKGIVSNKDTFTDAEKKYIPNSKILELFCSIISVHLSSFYDNINYNLLQSLAKDDVKAYDNCYRGILIDTENEEEKYIIDNMTLLIRNAIAYKTFEIYTHQFSIHQFLIKNLDFDNLMNQFSDILNYYKQIDSQNFIMQKIYENILYITSRFDDSCMKLDIDVKLGCDKLKEEEKYIYEFLKKTNKDIKDLWCYYTFHSKELCLLKNKKKGMEYILSVFKQIFEIQKTFTSDYEIRSKALRQYYNNEIGNNINDINTATSNNAWEMNITNEIKRYDEYSQQVYNIIKDMDINKELLTKEMIVGYASSVIQAMQLKKMLLSLVLSAKKKSNLP